jgi:hypothetical protein
MYFLIQSFHFQEFTHENRVVHKDLKDGIKTITALTAKAK